MTAIHSLFPDGPVSAPSNALNFSGGPGALPATVLRQARDAIDALPETGISVLGMSHRSDWFRDLELELEGHFRDLLGLDDRFAITFLQGGSSLLFATIPMNFATAPAVPPQYVNSGYWSARATGEAARVTPCDVIWDGADTGYRQLPDLSTLDVDRRAPFVHYVSNETVEGLQFPSSERDWPIPLIADMSSDLLSRPMATDSYSMIYAHAQKNLGPAGVTVALIRRDLLQRVPDTLPPILDLRTHVAHRSNYNTPPVFAIYVMTLVMRWLRNDVGGLDAMHRINEAKAGRLYGTLDALGDMLGVYAAPEWRSRMNASFRFHDERLDAAFIAEAAERGIIGLEGHRSVGGLRVSLYNAVTEQAVEQLCIALRDFCRKHG